MIGMLFDRSDNWPTSHQFVVARASFTGMSAISRTLAILHADKQQ